MAGLITQRALPRRLFLRAAGATLALPWLDAMVPALAAAPESGPVRLGFFYVPNGMAMPSWRVPAGAAGAGTGLTLSPTLEPLAGLRSHLTVVSGLAHLTADRPGGPGPHARAAAAWLSGLPLDVQPDGTARGALTVDQIAAQTLGAGTPVPSLALAADTADAAAPAAVATRTISWSGPDRPVLPLTDPRDVFLRLFGVPPGGEPAERPSRSLLDGLHAQITAVEKRLGPRDKAALDEYVTAVREVEAPLTPARQRQGSARTEAGEPLEPSADPDAHAAQLLDLLYLAYRSDLTRVATVMLGFEGSDRTYTVDGAAVAHHAVSHHQGDPARLARLAAINRQHVAVFARFCERLQATPDGDGTLLDRAMLLYGAGMSDPDPHRMDDLPLAVVGGGNGALAGDRHLRYQGAEPEPMTNLLLGLLAKAGTPAQAGRLGDSTGVLAAF